MQMRVIRTVIAAALLALLIGVPGSAAALPQGQVAGHAGYVGTVSGTRAFVAVVEHGSRVTAYVCNSGSIAQWFNGAVSARRSKITSRGGYVLEVRFGDGRATGSLRFPGRAGTLHHFTAGSDVRPAGLWRGSKTVGGKTFVGGWIILPDGRQRGEILSGSTDVGSPILHTDDPKAPVSTQKSGGHIVVIAIIAILIG
jgi:hypothetical protein